MHSYTNYCQNLHKKHFKTSLRFIDILIFSILLVYTGNFGFTEKITVKYAGAAAMYFVSKNLKKKYNITDERAALYEAAEQWVEALNGREFLGRFLHLSTFVFLDSRDMSALWSCIFQSI